MSKPASAATDGRQTDSFAARWHAFFVRPVPNLALRTATLVLGFSFIALGVALSRSTGLGTSPISCVPAVLSFAAPVSTGAATFVLNVLFIAAQALMLRRDFKPVQLLQLPMTLVFSVLIDLFGLWTQTIPMDSYAVRLALLAASAPLTALGVFLEVKASLVPLPGEGVTTTAARVTGVDFPRVKLLFDLGNVALGTAISLAAMHGLYGVREGTVIAALAIGPLVRVLNRAFPHFERAVPTREAGLLLRNEGRP